MIPKIIHYCWFGGREKPNKVRECINSWHKYMPDYKFMEWNEQNFDVGCSEYVRQAYHAQKYAFVSDIARIRALREYGGIYMDTDVRVFKSFNPILDHRCIFGFEYGNWVATSFMACEPGHPILDAFNELYENEKFISHNGKFNTTTNVERLTALLIGKGLVRNNRIQELDEGIWVCPIEYFSPYDYVNCVMERTRKSYCAHLFLVSWLPASQQFKKGLKKAISGTLGKNTLIQLREKKDLHKKGARK